MGVSDVVAGNIAALYLAVIAAVKAYGLTSRQVIGGVHVLVVSSAVVGLILAVCLIWDVSRRANRVLPRLQQEDTCRGGICWHGVAVRSPASQLRFRLPPNVR